MRIASLLVFGFVASVSFALLGLACGGVAERDPAAGATHDGTGAGGAGSTAGTQQPKRPSGTTGDPKPEGPGGPVDPTCANATNAIVLSGGTIARPIGSALRLQLVYQGSSIGITAVRGVNMTLPGADGPFTSDNSGYWVETRGPSASLYQRLLRDPTRLEVFPGPPGSGQGFENKTIDRCSPKPFSADVPNDSSATTLVIFGSPYGTQDGAIELARFTLE